MYVPCGWRPRFVGDCVLFACVCVVRVCLRVRVCVCSRVCVWFVRSLPWYLLPELSLGVGPSSHVMSCIVGGAFADPCFLPIDRLLPLCTQGHAVALVWRTLSGCWPVLSRHVLHCWGSLC
jgi:hypothetical protein